MNRLRAIVVAWGLLASITAPLEASVQRARVGERWALIVSTGSASRESARALARLLTESYGFGSDAVVLLNGAEATLEHIQTAMSKLQAGVRPYDAVFAYFSLDQRPDPSRVGGFSFIPAGAAEGEPWTWLPVRRVIEWLSALPVSSGLVVYPSCPTKFDDYLIGELGHGKRPGSLELMRVCERSSAGQTAPDAKGSEQWRAHFMGKTLVLLKDIASRRVPVSAAEVAAKLQNSAPETLLDVRRVPEYITEGFIFEPVAQGVAREQSRYRSATQNEQREAALRNIPGIVKTASDPARESQLAAQFLGDVATDAAAGLQAQLDAPARLSLRMAAVESLAELRNDPARDRLDAIAEKAADAPFIRRAALTQISRLTPPRPADLAAVRAAFPDQDPSVREAAVRTAVILNDTAAVASLQDRLGNETESAVRVALIQALTALGTHDRVTLIGLLRDPDEPVRREAVTALGRLGPNAEATLALIGLLGNDASPDVRRQAAYSLGHIQPEGGTEQPPLAVTSALLDALRIGPSAVREAVAYALGRTGGPAAEKALRELLRHGTTEAESVAAAEALGQLKSEAALDDLVAVLLNSPDRPGLRRASAAALGALGKPAAALPLATALDDRDPFVQRQAQQSLEQIPMSRENLARALQHRSPRIRLVAVSQAGKSSDPEVVPLLITALADSDADVRQAAITALGAHRDPKSIDRLEHAARSESDPPSDNRLTQFGALSALATIPDLQAFQAILALAQESSDPTLRVEVLGALGTQVEWLRKMVGSTATPDPEATRALSAASSVAQTAAKHDSAAVRRAATPALAAFPEGRGRLQEMAKLDPSPEVQSAAIEQLSRVGTRKD